MSDLGCCNRCGKYTVGAGRLAGSGGDVVLICSNCDNVAPAGRGDVDTEVAGNLAHRLPAVGSRAYSYNEALVMAKARIKSGTPGRGRG